MIAAVARNRAIGFENKLIYWLPNDLKRFKALTTGHTIVMGRNTFLSLPKETVGNPGIHPHVLIVGRVLYCGDTRLPIKFGHAFLHHAVVGVAQPVAGLTLRDTSQWF